MPLSFCLLGSGSKGNSIYISDGNGAVIVDAGLSAKQCMLRMEARGLDPEMVRGIVITHEHTDHVKGARVLAKRLKTPVWASRGTWKGVGDLEGAERCQFRPGKGFRLGGLELLPFLIPHDALEPVGLVVQANGVRLGLATDLGKATTLVQGRLAGCQALIIEANHDPVLLKDGPYPPWLKQRVRGNHGHLSNQQGAELAAGLCHEGLKEVVLAHLSETNNDPAAAREAAQTALMKAGYGGGLHVAAQTQPTCVIEL